MLEEEIVVKAIDLDVRVVKAKDSETETEKLIIEFTPFLRSRVARYSARYDEYQRDTLFSTAMLAFHEAILNFNIEMGRFLPYAERVIRSRIIDNIREMNRKEGNTIPLFEDNDELNSAESPAIREISMRKYEADLRQEMLAQEIEQFESEIQTWGITMDALAKSSPKHKQLRKTYYDALSAVINNQDIVQTIQIKRYFPIKAISKITGLPPNKLERARIFILASLTIKTGDYCLLSDFLH